MAPTSPTSSRRRLLIVVSTWLVFTVIIGMAGVIGQVIHDRTLGDIDLSKVLRGGELFVVSTVIAADATGRWFRSVYFCVHDGGPKSKPWGFASVFVSILCVYITAQYYVSSLEFSRDPGTELSLGLVQDSWVWFTCTVYAAGFTVIAADGQA
jgi:hypothetical protein